MKCAKSAAMKNFKSHSGVDTTGPQLQGQRKRVGSERGRDGRERIRGSGSQNFFITPNVMSS